MTETGNVHPKSLWLSIGRQALTFAVGVITAAFVLGGTRQKIHDMTVWRDQTAPRIERMDSTGTLSFDLFHKEYQRTQTRQEESLKDLDKRVRELEKKIDP
jgi:hypothetical protein